MKDWTSVIKKTKENQTKLMPTKPVALKPTFVPSSSSKSPLKKPSPLNADKKSSDANLFTTSSKPNPTKTIKTKLNDSSAKPKVAKVKKPKISKEHKLFKKVNLKVWFGTCATFAAIGFIVPIVLVSTIDANPSNADLQSDLDTNTAANPTTENPFPNSRTPFVVTNFSDTKSAINSFHTLFNQSGVTGMVSYFTDVTKANQILLTTSLKIVNLLDLNSWFTAFLNSSDNTTPLQQNLFSSPIVTDSITNQGDNRFQVLTQITFPYNASSATPQVVVLSANSTSTSTSMNSTPGRLTDSWSSQISVTLQNTGASGTPTMIKQENLNIPNRSIPLADYWIRLYLSNFENLIS
ncbi:hypothetical protein [[Mycoplasma] testudinis]|uniref:hypothetical protein n=1 Tax=[Mycoplasma] testudinis TaxID=33924 RepID=UPI0004856832|nr:hypothetical protein [[Mycoplasma] testudinis]